MAEREVRFEKADFINLGNRWEDACLKFGLKDKSGPGRLSVFEQVAKSYIQRGGYHGLDHLGFMFKLLDQYRALLRHPEIVDFAVFFHDVVYLAGSKYNETDSAWFASIHLSAIGADQETTKKVSDFILATREHKVVPGSVDDLEYFLDSDMAILGSDAESYRKYSLGIAQDFKSIDPLQYVQGRQRFLKGLMYRRIFSTNEMHSRFQDQAQINIEHEFSQLQKIENKLDAAN